MATNVLRKKLAEKKSKVSTPMAEIEDHPANLDYFEDRDFRKILIEQLQPNPDQPREDFNEESLNELAESIKEHGILQPVIVRKDENNKHQYILIRDFQKAYLLA